MDNYQKYLNPQTLASLQGLELRARLIVEGYVSGVHRSPYHGFSIEFAEHREYVAGDDLRYRRLEGLWPRPTSVSQAVRGRDQPGELHAAGYQRKHALQERPGALSKLEYAQCAAGALSYLVLQQQDSVGLATFDKEIRALVRPSSNPSHLKHLLHVMDEAVPERKTASGPDLSRPGRALQETGHRAGAQRLVRRRDLAAGGT